MSMIFKNYRELINYVLHNYPYDKIITYCFDLRYKLVIGRDNNNYTIKYPTKLDLKKFLLCVLSRLCSNSYVYSAKKLGIEDQKVMDIYTHYWYNKYFSARFSSDRKSLIINFKFDYFGYRFSKYSIPTMNPPLYGNPRTRVIFKFNDVIIYE